MKDSARNTWLVACCFAIASLTAPIAGAQDVEDFEDWQAAEMRSLVNYVTATRNGQQAADDDILLHQANGRIDIDGVVMHLGHDQTGVIERPFVQIFCLCPDALHYLDDIDAGLANHIDDDGFGGIGPDLGIGFDQIVFDVCYIGDRDTRDAPGAGIEARAQNQTIHPFQAR